MSRAGTVRQYGKQTKRSRAERLFAELPQSPVNKIGGEKKVAVLRGGEIDELSELVAAVRIRDGEEDPSEADDAQSDGSAPKQLEEEAAQITEETNKEIREETDTETESKSVEDETSHTQETSGITEGVEDGLRILTWDDVCPFGDKIEKIAEASYAEVYRVTNPRGTSIIKVIRLKSPIRAQTKAQERSGLVDEEPHDEDDLIGELRISEWLADIPGFVVYKDRYIVRGKAPKTLVETHQGFHRRMKRKDPDRLQFYPSPSRYLEDTKFLVVELGDAGTALEDFGLESVDQLWDIFLLVAIALARAEDLILFEHRDLHEGNLCIRQANPPRSRDESLPDVHFGYSGLDITILDYGLSRAEDEDDSTTPPVAYDLEKDLSLFTSTHADQCRVYRQMRSFLLRGDRKCLPASQHTKPYAPAFDGDPISWTVFAPYTNVLWLAYIYEYLVAHFSGERKELTRFKRLTKEMWTHLNPGAKAGTPCFGSAGDVVRFAVEAGWILESHVVGDGSTFVEREDSIVVEEEGGSAARLRRSPRQRRVD
ncbi:Protein kinase-like domain [Scedosporium apiospermum]|uniref:non-specific serine/threonine protein kinase n=1 Tax=Pseudallescheria apiosperma TaxID=563466 RepID=A0A084GBV2_PSEDA|nr:Protein kinase-like domain [Scedosporium apiospermum]KEZ44814.1 Protein kinase-like domain [Scedosporium apiospermum]